MVSPQWTRTEDNFQALIAYQRGFMAAWRVALVFPHLCTLSRKPKAGLEVFNNAGLCQWLCICVVMEFQCIHEWFGPKIERRIFDCTAWWGLGTACAECSCYSHNAGLLLPSGVLTLNRKPLFLLPFALGEIKHRTMSSQWQKKGRVGANNKDIKANCIYGDLTSFLKWGQRTLSSLKATI